MRSSAGSIDIPWVNSQSGWGGNDAACSQLCSCRGMFACLLLCIEHRPPLSLLPYTPTFTLITSISTLITASLHSNIHPYHFNIHPYHCFLTLKHPPLSLLPYTPTSTRITASSHFIIHLYHRFPHTLTSTLITASSRSMIHLYLCFLTL